MKKLYDVYEGKEYRETHSGRWAAVRAANEILKEPQTQQIIIQVRKVRK